MDHAGIVKQMFAAFPHVEASRETVAVYLKLLSDISAADLQVAVDDAICESEFLPTIALIRQCHEDRVRYRVRPENWIVGSPPVPQLQAPEPEPVRILREIDDLRDADMCMDEDRVRIVVADLQVAEKRLAWQVARKLESAGLEAVDVVFVVKERVR